MNRRRLALRVLLASIVMSAFLGIIAVLGAGGGAVMWKALATSITVSGATVLIMVAFVAWEVPAAVVISRAAAIAANIAAVLMIIGFWAEMRSDHYWQFTATMVVIALATAHTTGLTLARLPPNYQWVRGAAVAVGVMLVACILALIWEVGKERSLGTPIGVLGILEAALSLAIVALGLASRSIPPADMSDEVRFCPRCGKSLWLPQGEIICRHCSEVFVVELREKLSELPNAVARERSAQ